MRRRRLSSNIHKREAEEWRKKKTETKQNATNSEKQKLLSCCDAILLHLNPNTLGTVSCSMTLHISINTHARIAARYLTRPLTLSQLWLQISFSVLITTHLGFGITSFSFFYHYLYKTSSQSPGCLCEACLVQSIIHNSHLQKTAQKNILKQQGCL